MSELFLRANDEIWTRDLFLTKEALYPWATPASPLYIIVPKMSGRRDSNSRPSAWKADALPTELLPLIIFPKCLVGMAGLEPAIPWGDRFTVCCNSHYATSPSICEPVEGFEPPTCWLQISCSSQLSYTGKFLFGNMMLKNVFFECFSHLGLQM